MYEKLNLKKDNINISYYVVIMSNISRITQQLVSVENLLCECKYKLLKIKWSHWVEWYFNIAQHLDDISFDDLIYTMNETQRKYIDEMEASEDIPKQLIKAFNTIHNIAMSEFKYMLEHKDAFTRIEEIRFVGDLLALLTQTSIFEMIELNLDCNESIVNDNSCCNRTCNINKNGSSFTVLVNDLFNVNSYGVKNIDMLSKNVVSNSENVGIIFDFSHCSYINEQKFKDIFIRTNELFKYIDIVNYEKHRVVKKILSDNSIQYRRLMIDPEITKSKFEPIINNGRVFNSFITSGK